MRAEAGTTPLVRNAALDKVASDWAYQQWKNGAMSHNPNYSTQIPAGWSHAGENVASGYTYDTVVQAWVNSAEHYSNLVGDYTDLGIGYYEGPDGNRYWVQEFAKYASTKVPPKQTPTAAPSTAPSSRRRRRDPATGSDARPSRLRRPTQRRPRCPTRAATRPSPRLRPGPHPAEVAVVRGQLLGLDGVRAARSTARTPAARGGKYALAVHGRTRPSARP